MPVYLDHNATTPVHSAVLAKLPHWAEAFGNPSSIHAFGRAPKLLLREAREALSAGLGCRPLEIVFTSGGSESNSTALRAAWHSRAEGRHEILISAVEHPSVRKTAQWLETQGAEIKIIPVDRHGRVDFEIYQSLVGRRTVIVSCMLANNETGSIFPIREMAAIAHSRGALFHCDAVQGLGKVPINLGELGVDFASFSGHKFYALKGSGVLYIKRNSPYVSLVMGGGQERGRRGGTENILAIASLGEMAEQLSEVENRGQIIGALRDDFEKRAEQQIPGLIFNGRGVPRLPNTSSLIVMGADGESLLMSLDLRGVAVSTGAACSAGSPEPSPVLLAMGVPRSEAQSSLRVSLGWSTTAAEMDHFLDVLCEVVERIRGLDRGLRQGEATL